MIPRTINPATSLTPESYLVNLKYLFFIYQYFVCVLVLMVLGISGSVVGMTQVCHEQGFIKHASFES